MITEEHMRFLSAMQHICSKLKFGPGLALALFTDRRQFKRHGPETIQKGQRRSGFRRQTAALRADMDSKSDAAWERCQARAAAGEAVYQAEQEAVRARAPKFRKGSRVRHESWGDGTVTYVGGNMLEVDFVGLGRLKVSLASIQATDSHWTALPS